MVGPWVSWWIDGSHLVTVFQQHCLGCQLDVGIIVYQVEDGCEPWAVGEKKMASMHLVQ